MKRLLVLTVVALFAIQPAYAETVQINLHSCCVTEDATTKEILPAFKKYYKEKFGKDVDVSASFAGSGTLKNQILGGAPAQVAVLSSELYLDQLKEKGLISSDWRVNPNQGAVIKSVIVFVTRKGNPKGLRSSTTFLARASSCWEALAGELAGAGFSPDTPFAIVSSQEDPGEPAAQSV